MIATISQQELIQKFTSNPCYLTNGAGFLAIKFNTTKEEIKTAKKIARGLILDAGAGTIKDAPKYYSGLDTIVEVSNPIITEEKRDNTTGNIQHTILSNKPLSPKEIDDLVQVDNITRKVGQTWLKSHKNGTWTYSVSTLAIIKDFYNSEDLKKKLKELFPNQSPFILNRSKNNSYKSIVIYISDDHAGMLLNNSIFNKTWTELDYETRLLKIVDKIKNMEGYFQEIIVVSLGDQLNGFNQETTRGGHIVASSSNKEQFDMYTRARIKFYDALFTSKKANDYSIYEVNDSNHSGLGYSYMANEFLRLYVTSKFPQVKVTNNEDFIVHINVQDHKILAVHGKDAKEQRNGFPLNLDPKTEIYFTDYMLSNDINPKKQFISVIKGDLHRYNENQGKSFRYINVPSIAEGSSWQEKNFSSSQAGVVIEIYEKGEPEPMKTVIRF